jgi:LmbE family N-acetylglucosaminyl deacetylase
MSEAHHIPYAASALPLDGARSVLVLAPHPDDEVFGCGGSAALLRQAGVRVRALILTDGGLWGVPPEGRGIVETREEEARQAARVLGCDEPLFARLPDRSLVPDGALIELVLRHARAAAADVLMAPSPWEIHPDHRAVALAAIEAVQALQADARLVQYEIGAPLLPNVLVNISPVHALKRDAMECFRSQLAMQAYDRHVHALNVFRTYTLRGDVTAAEAMRIATAAQARQDPFGLDHGGNLHPVAAAPRPGA